MDSFAKTLLYADVPKYYTWNNKSWCRRKQGTDVAGFAGIKEAHVLGRIYTINPRQGECFYLSLLLHHIRGPQSFANQVTLLTFTSITRNLWQRTFLHQQRTRLGNNDLSFNDDIFNLALDDLQDKVFSMGGRELSEYGLPQPQTVDNDRFARVYRREIDYDQAEQQAFVEQNVPLLTADQRQVYDCFCSMIDGDEGGMLFLDAPGGTGKTFLINLILAKLRLEGKIALATASSGIAATLLTVGRTLHSTFKIPLDLYTMDIPLCSIKKGTALSRVILEGKATVVDEAPMTNKLAFEALDRTLRDLTGKERPMGGMCMLLCGDFRQILPVIQGGTRGNIVDSCLKKSFLWDHIIVKHLHTNMRVHLHWDEAAGELASQLLAIGDGKYPIDTSPDIIQLPENI